MNVGVNSYSRVFVIPGGAYPNRQPSFESCFIAGALEQSFGDIESIECPDPNQYSRFITVGEIQGASERPTLSLTGRFQTTTLGTLARAAMFNQPIDVHVNFGSTDTPGDVNTFDVKLVLTNARMSSNSTDELGALASGDAAPVNETYEVSGDSSLRVLPLSVASLAGSVITNEIIDVVVVSDTNLVRNTYEAIYALSKAAGGSPSTPADVVFSIDGGSTWYAHDVDTLSSNEPTGIGVLVDKLVVITNAGGALHYADVADFDAGVTDPSFTQVTTGIVSGGKPNAIWVSGNTAFIVGDGGYVYKCTDATAGVEVLSAASATTANLNSVHAFSSERAIAGGASGVVIYTLNGTTWTACTSVPAASTINAVWMYDETLWWAGTASGKLFYTTDQGDSWTEKAFSGSGSGSVRDIAFFKSIMYVAHSTATPAGRLFKSQATAGYSFTRVPEKSGSMPANDRITAIATSSIDPNFVVGGGLADNGTDGFLVIASA